MRLQSCNVSAPPLVHGEQDSLAAVRAAMAPWWPLGIDRAQLAAAVSGAERAGVAADDDALRRARALLAEERPPAAAASGWSDAALRLAGVRVPVPSREFDCELQQVELSE